MGAAHERALRDTPDTTLHQTSEEGNPFMGPTASPTTKPLARRLTSSLLLALFAGAAGPALADAVAEDLAAQLDQVALVVNGEAVEQLGGPEDPAALLDGLDGQWFTLNNLSRNWGEDGVGFDAADLASAMTRQCGPDADIAVHYAVTGENSFTVHELVRTHEAELTTTVTAREGRMFTLAVDEEALLRSYGIGEDDEEARAEILAANAILIEQGIALWRPTPDIVVMVTPFGVDVTGRCAPA